MSNDPNDVVRVAAAGHVVIELYRQAMEAEGIPARVLGEALEASFGTAIPRSVELWVHRSDADRARAVIRRMEAERGETVSFPEEPQKFPHPTGDPKHPHPGGHGPHTHYNPDPRA